MISFRKKIFLPPIFFIFFLLPFSFLFLSCEKSTAPVNNPRVTLTAEYVGVTDAELILQTRNIEPNTQYQLFRDDSLVNRGTLSQGDTTVIDTLLFPAHSYSYKAQLIKDGDPVAYSQPLQITTMDTTSHKFQWESYIIDSPYGSAMLRDVAIISPTDIWAVGAIAADSAHPGVPYNVVHWDGNKWSLKKIYYRTQSGNTAILTNIQGITYLSPNDIWFAAGSVFHYDGTIATTSYSREIGTPETVYNLWYSNENDIYGVGDAGTIVHYNGYDWQKLESPVGAGDTVLDFQDIWGITDTVTGQSQVLAVASNLLINDGCAVVQLTGAGVSLIQTDGLPPLLSGIWSPDGREWYVCGDGLYRSRSLERAWEKVKGMPPDYQECIRGNGGNDITVVQHDGKISHWNGYSWYTYTGLPGRYHGLAVAGDLVVAVGQIVVGFVGGPAAIVVGRRN
jgi:hypothetical protein